MRKYRHLVKMESARQKVKLWIFGLVFAVEDEYLVFFFPGRCYAVKDDGQDEITLISNKIPLNTCFYFMNNFCAPIFHSFLLFFFGWFIFRFASPHISCICVASSQAQFFLPLAKIGREKNKCYFVFSETYHTFCLPSFAKRNLSENRSALLLSKRKSFCVHWNLYFVECFNPSSRFGVSKKKTK